MSQETSLSPFSRLSIGEQQDAAFSQNFGMGRLSNALQDPSYINPYNPASYAKIFWTSFEVAVITRNIWLENNRQSQQSNLTNFNHLAMGMPVTPWWGFSFGIMPVSFVGYNYQSYESLTESDGTEVTFGNKFTGNGGINKAQIGSGFAIKRRLYLGFNFSYQFGQLEYQETIEYDNIGDYNNSASLETVDVGDIYFDFGAQYRMNLGNKWRMDLGAVFTPIQGLASKRDEFKFTFKNISGTPRIIDTVSYSENASFSIVLPPKYGFGVLFNRGDNWKMGFDVNYTMWSLSNYNTYGGLEDAYKVKVGGEFSDPDGRYKIRLGANYGNLPLVISDSRSDQMAASAGVAFPFRSKDKLTNTVLNIGVEVGQRGKTTDLWIKERFINVHIGLTLNNKWFIKRVYD
jgi:hypothetical protein